LVSGGACASEALGVAAVARGQVQGREAARAGACIRRGAGLAVRVAAPPVSQMPWRSAAGAVVLAPASAAGTAGVTAPARQQNEVPLAAGALRGGLARASIAAVMAFQASPSARRKKFSPALGAAHPRDRATLSAPKRTAPSTKQYEARLAAQASRADCPRVGASLAGRHIARSRVAVPKSRDRVARLAVRALAV
jgi:hypothetical protein